MLARICPGLWNAFVQTRKSLLLTYTAAGLTAHLVKFWLDFSPSVGTVEQGITPTLVRDGSSSRTLLHQRTLGRQIAPLWSLVQVAAKTKHSLKETLILFHFLLVSHAVRELRCLP